MTLADLVTVSSGKVRHATSDFGWDVPSPIGGSIKRFEPSRNLVPAFGVTIWRNRASFVSNVYAVTLDCEACAALARDRPNGSVCYRSILTGVERPFTSSPSGQWQRRERFPR